jgi:hypothetical protein
MRRLTSLAIAIIALATASPSAVAGPEWQPPVGIPRPSFGISEVAPSAPEDWSGQVENFYYVEESNPYADDTDNPYGWPGRPRRTIPVPLPAGAVVELRGTYSAPHTSPYGIVAEGTRENPVFIRGANASERPYISSCWELSGSYFIVENVEFGDCTGFVFLSPAHHAALRHSNLHGTPGGGGVGVQSWDRGPSDNIVIFDNDIHHMGDVNANYDQDNHGIAIGADVHHIWVLENRLYENSGDGVQINAGARWLEQTTHHIYVGRNKAWGNKQGGFWVKQATDVIISENISANHRPSNSSPGACMGAQYAPDFVWFINNTIFNCDYGIQIASDSGLGSGQWLFIIGNIITQIHDSNGDFNPDTAWHNCAISLPGGVTRVILQNSIYDVDSGICTPSGAGVLHVFDNLIHKVRSNGYHMFVESSALAGRSMAAAGNLFGPDYKLSLAGRKYKVPSGRSGKNYVVGDMRWVNPDGGDFRLGPNSPALDRGVTPGLGIWDAFAGRYGESIARDVYGAGRPGGRRPDAGASEH